MEIHNNDRLLVEILEAECKKQGVIFTPYSHKWIIELAKGEKRTQVFGYHWALNSSTAQKFAQDKAAASEMLEAHGVPTVEHNLFLKSSMRKYVDLKGNWPVMMAYAQKNHWRLVAKPNEGTGGKNIFFIADQVDLEEAVQELFALDRSLVLSPWYDISAEYRTVILNGEIMLQYGKHIPVVVGDGQQTLTELLQQAGFDEEVDEIRKREPDLQPDSVLQEGREVRVLNQHNLSGGAEAKIVEDEELKKRISEIVRAAADAIGITFASIDVVQVGDELKVLEINSGVMMEHFARQSQEHYEIARTIYAKALELSLGK